MRHALAAFAAVAVSATPALATETIVAPFTAPSTATADAYSGLVQITVSGIGNAQGANLNDAFYLTATQTTGRDGYYQLGFSTSPLVPFDFANAAYQYVVGGRPAYDPTHIYTFVLDTGLATPGTLYFGVTDGDFADNGGAFTITISSVPESATWAMMIAGFGAVGYTLRRRRARIAVAA